MSKRVWLAAVAVFVTEFAYNFVVHSLILEERFYAAQRGTLWRTLESAPGYMFYMIAAYVLLSIGIAWVYGKGVSDAPAGGQGVRFGLALSAMIYLPWALINYTVMPLSSQLFVYWAVAALVEGQLVGQVVARVWGVQRPAPTPL